MFCFFISQSKSKGRFQAYGTWLFQDLSLFLINPILAEETQFLKHTLA